MFDETSDSDTGLYPDGGYANNRHVFVRNDVDGKVAFECTSWPKGLKPAYALFNRLSDDATAAETYNTNNLRITYGHATHGDNIVATLRDEQYTVHANSFGGNVNLAAGKIVEGEDGFTVELKNLCGLLSFTLSEKPKSIVLKGNNNEIIAGGKPGNYSNRIRICFNEDGTPYWKTISSDGAKQITLTAADNVWSAENKYYFCVLPPRVGTADDDANYNPATNSGTFTKGITITVETADGETYTKTGKSALTLTRNEVVDLGNISKENADKPEELPEGALVLDLPMTADALPAGFPTAAKNGDPADNLDEKEWAFTIGEQTYKFGFNPDAASDGNGQIANGDDKTPGYYFDTTNNYFVLGSTYAYIKFPAVPDMCLKSVSVSVVNTRTSGDNPIKACAIVETPFVSKLSDNANFVSFDGTASVYLSKDDNKNGSLADVWKGTDYTWSFDDTKAGTSYSFQSRNGQIWLAKLTLTYVPATTE